MTNSTIVKSAFLAASRETVWAFLTEAEKLGLWFHPAEQDLAAGEAYTLINKVDDGTTSKMCWGEVLEMDASTTLIYTFSIRPLGGAMTAVTWGLEECHGGTKLTLKHEGISEAAGEAAMGLPQALDKGWDGHIRSMREAIE